MLIPPEFCFYKSFREMVTTFHDSEYSKKYEMGEWIPEFSKCSCCDDVKPYQMAFFELKPLTKDKQFKCVGYTETQGTPGITNIVLMCERINSGSCKVIGKFKSK